jgi:hypothetical protein
MHTSHAAPTRKDLRNFGLIMAGMILLFFGFLIPWIWNHRPWPLWPWMVSAVFVVVGLASPMVLGAVYRAWMKVGLVLGWINSRIILGVMFYGLVLPMGLIMRMMGKDPMARRLESDSPSYRVRSKKAPRDQLERPF